LGAATSWRRGLCLPHSPRLSQDSPRLTYPAEELKVFSRILTRHLPSCCNQASDHNNMWQAASSNLLCKILRILATSSCRLVWKQFVVKK
jgi:hypothetical protein